MALDYKHLLYINDLLLRHNTWHGTKHSELPGFFTPYESLSFLHHISSCFDSELLPHAGPVIIIIIIIEVGFSFQVKEVCGHNTLGVSNTVASCLGFYCVACI